MHRERIDYDLQIPRGLPRGNALLGPIVSVMPPLISRRISYRHPAIASAGSIILIETKF
jgi:hypothetical protein